MRAISAGLLVTLVTTCLFNSVAASDVSIPPDCPYPTWKAACQRFCLCQGYTIQANRCYAKDQCTLVCRCSDKSFSTLLREKFAAVNGLQATQCPAENPDEFPKLEPGTVSPLQCDGDCQQKCTKYLDDLVKNPNLQIIPDNGDDPELQVHAKSASEATQSTDTSTPVPEQYTDTSTPVTDQYSDANAEVTNPDCRRRRRRRDRVYQK
jgi:hypothetical protein